LTGKNTNKSRLGSIMKKGGQEKASTGTETQELGLYHVSEGSSRNKSLSKVFTEFREVLQRLCEKRTHKSRPRIPSREDAEKSSIVKLEAKKSVTFRLGEKGGRSKVRQIFMCQKGASADGKRWEGKYASISVCELSLHERSRSTLTSRGKGLALLWD